MRNRVWAERELKRPLFFVCAALVFLVAAMTATGAVSRTAASPPPVNRRPTHRFQAAAA